MKNLFILFLFIFVLPSCYKDHEVFIPNQQYVINNDLLLTSLFGSPESYVVDVDNQHIISLPGDIVIEWPNNNVRDIENNLITGKIKIEFKEYTKPRAGLMNCPVTWTYNQWINSDRIIYLKLTQDGKIIQLNQPLTIYLSVSSSSEPKDVQLYTLNREGGVPIWNESSAHPEQLQFGNWSISESGKVTKEIIGYKLILNPIHDWLMIGQPTGIRLESNFKCVVDLPEGFSDSNTLVYFIGNKNNLVFKLDYVSSNNQFYTSMSVKDKYIDGKIVLIGQISENEYYFGTTNVVLGEDTNVKTMGTLMSFDKIKAAIRKL